MYLKGLVFLLFAFSILVFSPRVMAAATFSGTISLPAGVNAGPSGVELRVGTAFIEFYTGPNGFPRFASDFVNIPPFANSTNFSFELPPSPSNDLNRVRFSCISGCESLDVTTSGNWSETEGVVAFFLGGTDYDSRQNQTIDIVLESADTFQGLLRLPEGFVANGDEQLIVRVADAAQFSLESTLESIFPVAGQTSFPFVVGMPEGGNGRWELEVYCLRCDQDVESADHYPTQLTGDPLTTNQRDAVLFSKNADYVNLSMTLISLRPDPNKPNVVNLVPIMYLLLDELP